jgi:hypothetical protein
LDAFEGAFGQVEVFHVLQVFEDGFADVVGFGAAGTTGQFFEAFLYRLGESDG